MPRAFRCRLMVARENLEPVMVLQMPADRVGTGVQAGIAEFFAKPHDQIHYLDRSGVW